MTGSERGSSEPPRLPETMLRTFLNARDREVIVGDLLEEYREVVLPARGRRRAQAWYVGQVIFLVDGLPLGLMLGAAFGVWNVLYTWLAPMADDTPLALLTFYGSMFVVWAGAALRTFRRTGQLREAIKTGATIGCVTFVVFNLTILIRGNVFLETLSQRLDWQGLLVNYRRSGFDSLRTYMNYVYVSGMPIVAFIGAVLGSASGLIGGLAGTLGRQRAHPLPSS